MTIEDIKFLIKSKSTCVLATAAGGEPHCSLMSYVADDDGRLFYMASAKDTRKYRNLLGNASVSLLIDTRDEGKENNPVKALTVKGVFQPITDGAEKQGVMHLLLLRHPQLKDIADSRDVEVFQIKAEAYELLQGISKASYFALQ